MLHWPVGTVKGRLSRARDVLRSRLLRRGLALSAAFLLTAFAQGRVFAEVVPAELARNTVLLARRFGPRRGRSGGNPRSGPMRTAGGGSDLPAKLAKLLHAASRLALARRLFFWMLVSILVFSTSAAVGLSATIRGGFSNRTGLSFPFFGGLDSETARANAESFAGAPLPLGSDPHCDRDR